MIIPLSPDQNIYETLMVDVTHRCNMTCKNCYLPDRLPPDISAHKIISTLAKLPKRTNIRLVGGEPTLREDLPDMIAAIRKLGHRVVLLTNGLRLAKKNYVMRLKAAGLRHVYISMNGGVRDEWYQEIDDLSCADKKIQAVKHAVEANMIVNTGTIMVRGVNEGAMAELIDYILSLSPRHAILRFKNIGAIGRYQVHEEKQNLSMAELVELASTCSDLDIDQIRQQKFIKGLYEPNSYLFPVTRHMKAGQGVWLKLTDWQADHSGAIDFQSQRRGRLMSDMTILPFFESFRE